MENKKWIGGVVLAILLFQTGVTATEENYGNFTSQYNTTYTAWWDYDNYSITFQEPQGRFPWGDYSFIGNWVTVTINGHPNLRDKIVENRIDLESTKVGDISKINARSVISYAHTTKIGLQVNTSSGIQRAWLSDSNISRYFITPSHIGYTTQVLGREVTLKASALGQNLTQEVAVIAVEVNDSSNLKIILASDLEIEQNHVAVRYENYPEDFVSYNSSVDALKIEENDDLYAYLYSSQPILSYQANNQDFNTYLNATTLSNYTAPEVNDALSAIQVEASENTTYFYLGNFIMDSGIREYPEPLIQELENRRKEILDQTTRLHINGKPEVEAAYLLINIYLASFINYQGDHLSYSDALHPYTPDSLGGIVYSPEVLPPKLLSYYPSYLDFLRQYQFNSSDDGIYRWKRIFHGGSGYGNEELRSWYTGGIPDIIMIHKDGSVHEKTMYSDLTGTSLYIISIYQVFQASNNLSFLSDFQGSLDQAFNHIQEFDRQYDLEYGEDDNLYPNILVPMSDIADAPGEYPYESLMAIEAYKAYANILEKLGYYENASNITTNLVQPMEEGFEDYFWNQSFNYYVGKADQRVIGLGGDLEPNQTYFDRWSPIATNLFRNKKKDNKTQSIVNQLDSPIFRDEWGTHWLSNDSQHFYKNSNTYGPNTYNGHDMEGGYFLAPTAWTAVGKYLLEENKRGDDILRDFSELTMKNGPYETIMVPFDQETHPLQATPTTAYIEVPASTHWMLKAFLDIEVNGTSVKVEPLAYHGFSAKNVSITSQGLNAVIDVNKNASGVFLNAKSNEGLNITFETTSYSLSGYIKDEYGALIQGALVSTAGMTTTSDVDGLYTFLDLVNGEYVVTASSGNTSNSAVVNISGGSVDGVNITLTEPDLTPPTVILNTPSNGSQVGEGNISLTCNMSDDHSLENATLYWNFSMGEQETGMVNTTSTSDGYIRCFNPPSCTSRWPYTGGFTYVGDLGGSDNEFRGYIGFDLSDKSHISKAEICIWGYVATGGLHNISIDMIEESGDDCELDANDWNATVREANVGIIPASDGNNRWWCFDVASEVQNALDDDLSCMAFSLRWQGGSDQDPTTERRLFASKDVTRLTFNDGVPYLNYSTGSPDWYAVESQTLSGNWSQAVFTETIAADNSILWNCLSCDISGNCATAPENWTFYTVTSTTSTSTSTTSTSTTSTSTTSTSTSTTTSTLPVMINELLPNAVGDDNAPMPDGEWIELFNPNDYSIDVDGWAFSDMGYAVMSIEADHTLWNSTVVPSAGFLVVYRNGDPFALPDDYFILHLLENGSPEDSASYDSSTYNLTFFPENMSVGRIPDGTDNWTSFNESTPGQPNTFPTTTTSSTTSTSTSTSSTTSTSTSTTSTTSTIPTTSTSTTSTSTTSTSTIPTTTSSTTSTSTSTSSTSTTSTTSTLPESITVYAGNENDIHVYDNTNPLDGVGDGAGGLGGYLYVGDKAEPYGENDDDYRTVVTFNIEDIPALNYGSVCIHHYYSRGIAGDTQIDHVNCDGTPSQVDYGSTAIDENFTSIQTSQATPGNDQYWCFDATSQVQYDVSQGNNFSCFRYYRSEEDYHDNDAYDGVFFNQGDSAFSPYLNASLGSTTTSTSTTSTSTTSTSTTSTSTSSTSTSSTTTTLDLTPPEVALVSPANGSLVQPEEVNFVCNASDEVELENVSLLWNLSEGSTQESYNVSDDGYIRCYNPPSCSSKALVSTVFIMVGDVANSDDEYRGLIGYDLSGVETVSEAEVCVYGYYLQNEQQNIIIDMIEEVNDDCDLDSADWDATIREPTVGIIPSSGGNNLWWCFDVASEVQSALDDDLTCMAFSLRWQGGSDQDPNTERRVFASKEFNRPTFNDGISYINVTLSSPTWNVQQSRDVSGVFVEETFNETDLPPETSVLWNCLSCDINGNCATTPENWTITTTE
ncbi:carboxypeptidase regulatory-like domain-containing protein [Candidatus Altiarchaeota archaeon]